MVERNTLGFTGVVFSFWGPKWTISALNSIKVLIFEVHASESNVATGQGENGGPVVVTQAALFFGKWEVEKSPGWKGIGNLQKTHVQIKRAQGKKK